MIENVTFLVPWAYLITISNRRHHLSKDVNDSPPPTHTTSQSTKPIPSISPILNSSTTTVEFKSTQRLVSNSSVAGPTQDSAGGTRVWASNEKTSRIFANRFLLHVISSIWPDGITLDWVQGREAKRSWYGVASTTPLYPPPTLTFPIPPCRSSLLNPHSLQPLSQLIQYSKLIVGRRVLF
jgi:hypothetical protein